MTQYGVTTTIELEADDPTEAALRADSLMHDTFTIEDTTSNVIEVVLTEDQQQEALKRAFEGTLFPSS